MYEVPLIIDLHSSVEYSLDYNQKHGASFGDENAHRNVLMHSFFRDSNGSYFQRLTIFDIWRVIINNQGMFHICFKKPQFVSKLNGTTEVTTIQFGIKYKCASLFFGLFLCLFLQGHTYHMLFRR
jgi:hypothetical protein